MLGRLIVPACASLLLLSGVASAQVPETVDDQAVQQGQRKLRDKLASDGYTDVRIAPGSYIVSAKDKDGHHVMMMISPTSMTVMKVPDESPSQAEVPDSGKDEIIQQ